MSTIDTPRLSEHVGVSNIVTLLWGKPDLIANRTCHLSIRHVLAKRKPVGNELSGPLPLPFTNLASEPPGYGYSQQEQ